MSLPDPPKTETLQLATAFHRKAVFRRGKMLIKDADTATPAVHALLKHLEQAGFEAAPRVLGTGFDEQERETLSFIEGEFLTGPWSLEASFEVGALLRRLHQATAHFTAPANAQWKPWFGRRLGTPSSFGHCDFAPWNIVVRNATPYALIDWEDAGPIDPLVELAQACWLNAKLHDDRVAELEGLPNVNTRAQQLRAVVEGYGLAKYERVGFVDNIAEFVIFATAAEADAANIKIDTPLDKLDAQVPWALAWRARSAAWITKNRRVLQNALS